MSPKINKHHQILIRKVAIYARVSTEEQAKEGYSISAQKQKLRAFCIAQDWDISGLYVDEGISAKDMKRPQLQRMIEDIKAGKIDCVLVYRLDRLTRSVLDLYKLLEIFDMNDCKFKSATEVYDTTTAMGRMFITIVAALAQWERENMGERISFGYAEKVRQGKYAHNIRPIGYDLDLKTGYLTINENEAKIIRTIFDLYLKGYGGNRICKYLNERKVTTKEGNKWNDKPLMQILKNPLYMGTIRWKDELAVDAAPAIIDKETFQSVQETIEKRRNLQPKQIYSDYIFSGALKCPSCGKSMVGFMTFKTNKDGKRREYRNYRCLRKKTGECNGSKSIAEKKLEAAFLAYLEDQEEYTSVLNEVASTTEPKEKSQKQYDQRALLTSELEKIDQRKKRWQYAWANQKITDEDLDKRMAEERELEETIKSELAELPLDEEIDQVDQAELQAAIRDIRENWNHLIDKEKKNLIQMVIRQINVSYSDDTHLKIEEVIYHDFSVLP
ncbi:recombinase family protein [Cytobacillus firmus]|uniref:recombinase family protein n=1 Tax=Cytobacillus firmus TaxID=1399 RepID=UPI0036AEA690